MIVENVKDFMQEIYNALNTRYDCDKIGTIEIYRPIISPVDNSFNIIVNRNILIYLSQDKHDICIYYNFMSETQHLFSHIDLNGITKIYLGLRLVEIIDIMLEERI